MTTGHSADPDVNSPRAITAMIGLLVVAAFATGKTMKLLKHYADPFATHAVAAPGASAIFPGLEGPQARAQEPQSG